MAWQSLVYFKSDTLVMQTMFSDLTYRELQETFLLDLCFVMSLETKFFSANLMLHNFIPLTFVLHCYKLQLIHIQEESM